jgi:hypothetical protein
MSDSILTQVTGSGRSLWGGEVTAEDANAASLFDMARNVLGNPYAPAPDTGDDPGDDGPDAGRQQRSEDPTLDAS